jgi:WD40 repeat protein
MTWSSLFSLLVAFGSQELVLPATVEPGNAEIRKPGQGVRCDRQGDPLPPRALARLGTLRYRHPYGSRALAFSRDGKTLASAGSDSIRLFDARTGKLLHQFPCYRNPEELRNFSPSDPTLVALGFAAEGRLLALEDHGASAVLYEAATGKKCWQITKTNPHLGTFSPDGKTLAIVDQSGIGITLRDLVTGKKLHEIGDQESLATAVGFSPDGKVLASGEAGEKNDKIRFWDVASGKELRQVALNRVSAYALAFLPDGKTLAVVYGTSGAKVLATEGLAGDEADFALALRDATTGKELRLLCKDSRLAGPMALAPDGKTLAVTTGGSVRLLDLATGQDREHLSGHQWPVEALAFSPNGKTLTSAAGDRTIRLWETVTGKQLRQTDLPGATLYQHIFLSPDSRWAGWIDGSYDLRVMDLSTRKEVAHRLLDAGTPKETAHFLQVIGPTEVTFSQDSRIVAFWVPELPDRETGEMRLWDTASGSELSRWRARAPWSIALSPDGRLMALGASDDIRLCERKTGKELYRLNVHRHSPAGVGFLSFSPDGKRLASCDSDQSIRLWEVSTGKGLGWVARHPASIPNLRASCPITFSPDGKLLASGGDDHTVRLWDVATARELGRFAGHEARVTALSFSSDGKALASASDDTTVLVWDVVRTLREHPGSNVRLSPRELETLWGDLADPDAARAYQAMGKLSAAAKAAPFLGSRLRPIPRADPERTARLVADLASKEFTVRRKAITELEGLADQAEESLRKAAVSNQPEVRHQAETLLAKLEYPLTNPERIRTLRAVEVLEHLGTAAAQEVLRDLASGAPEARLTREAKLALERLRLAAILPLSLER